MDAQGLQQLLENNREKIIEAVDQAEKARHGEEIQRRGEECAIMYDRISNAFRTLATSIGGSEVSDSIRTFEIVLEQGDYVDFGKGFIAAEIVGVNPPYQEAPFIIAQGFAGEYFFAENATGETTARILLGSEAFQASDRSDDGLTEDSLVLENPGEWTEAAVLNAEEKTGYMKALAYQTLSLLTECTNNRGLNPHFDDAMIDKEYLEPLRPSE